MKCRRVIWISFFVSLFIWAVFSWPLPKHLFHGIPSSSQNIEKDSVRRMIPGDHLQLLYNFWLASDMLSGKTPMFSNLYEFNEGDDAARRLVKAYYFPISFIYTLGSWMGGRAFGWNFTGFLTLWFTYLFTWLLVRRYVTREIVAASFSLISILIPFRWVNLLGGSPAGFAMMWFPILLLGLDLAVRDDNKWGGWLAGLAVLFSCWSDTQTFFYSALVMPIWCVVAFSARPAFAWKQTRSWMRLAVALLPAAVFTLAAIFYKTSGGGMPGGALGADRDISEVAIFSPVPAGLFSWQNYGISSHIYIGWTLVILLLIGFLFALGELANSRGKSTRSFISFLLLCVIIVGMIALALGTNGPRDGLAYRLFKQLIPFYSAIRQPAKVFVLLPSFLAVAGAWAGAMILTRISSPGLRRTLFCLLILWLVIEFRYQVRATVCLLDADQKAYRAVAEDAAARQQIPRALVIPLWPGDSSWSSLYEHYVSLYRIRMINGYHPVVRKEYLDNVFRKFESGNQGSFSDQQLDDLQKKGIDWIILHENAFPEKVSPFAVGFTLKRLLNNPRLELLRQDRAVWSFRILNKPMSRPEQASGWEIFSPARRWEIEECLGTALKVAEAECSSGAFGRFDSTGAVARLRPTRLSDAPELRWLVRSRGSGDLEARIIADDEPLATTPLVSTSPDWTWVPIPVPSLGHHTRIELQLLGANNTVDADEVILVSGSRPGFKPGESMEIPAPCFFHAGYTDIGRNSVMIRQDEEPDSAIFYGPDLPFEIGSYEAELIFESAAPAGIELGSFTVHPGADIDVETAVKNNEPAKLEFDQKANWPLRISFTFARNADIEIQKVVFRRSK